MCLWYTYWYRIIFYTFIGLDFHIFLKTVCETEVFINLAKNIFIRNCKMMISILLLAKTCSKHTLFYFAHKFHNLFYEEYVMIFATQPVAILLQLFRNCTN